MSNNPYEILGVSYYSTLDEITVQYNKLTERLKESVLLEGREGTDAADKLQQVKEAYQEILYVRNSYAEISEDNIIRPLGRIEDLIKQGELIESQKMLDAQTERGAEWHYVQAALYYKQGWVFESKKQLELAIQMSPNEEKYSKAYWALVNFVNNPNPEGEEEEQFSRSYPKKRAKKSEMCGDTCATCGIMLCCEGCCECCCEGICSGSA